MSSGDVTVQTTMSTNNIKQYEELVCYYKDTDAQPRMKKAKMV